MIVEPSKHCVQVRSVLSISSFAEVPREEEAEAEAHCSHSAEISSEQVRHFPPRSP